VGRGGEEWGREWWGEVRWMRWGEMGEKWVARRVTGVVGYELSGGRPEYAGWQG